MLLFLLGSLLIATVASLGDQTRPQTDFRFLSTALCTGDECIPQNAHPVLTTPPVTPTVSQFFKLAFSEQEYWREHAWQDIQRSISAALGDVATVPPKKEVDECIDFLITFMPASDRTTVTISFISETVSLALTARYGMPWGLAVPWSIFLNDVLPYACLTEPRERWRPLFYTYYSSVPALNNASFGLAEAAQWMNTYGWNIRTPRIVFRADPSPVGVWDYDPFSVLFNGYASCTGLSIFLVSAMRSIGIPARVAGTPHWNLGPSVCPDGDQSPDCGNHDWVEVWVNGGWAFVDEDGDTALNTSWFVPQWTKHQSPAVFNHSIFAVSWANSSYIVANFGGDNDPLANPVSFFPMVWNWSVKVNSGWEVTKRYLLFS